MGIQTVVCFKVWFHCALKRIRDEMWEGLRKFIYCYEKRFQTTYRAGFTTFNCTLQNHVIITKQKVVLDIFRLSYFLFNHHRNWKRCSSESPANSVAFYMRECFGYSDRYMFFGLYFRKYSAFCLGKGKIKGCKTC